MWEGPFAETVWVLLSAERGRVAPEVSAVVLGLEDGQRVPVSQAPMEPAPGRDHP